MRNVLRIYPIRTTRKKWGIKLFKPHKCGEYCSMNIQRIDSNDLLITTNPSYVDGKCENYNKIEKTMVRLCEINNDENSEEDSICNSDVKVIPDNSFIMTLFYPLSYIFEVVISSDTLNGFTLKDLLRNIKLLYKFIYEEEERTATPQIYEIKKFCLSCGSKDLLKYIKTVPPPENDSCCICYDSFESNIDIAELNCKHNFHNECIGKWFEKSGTCPVCRFNVFECKDCDGSGIIHYQYTGVVIPIEERGINSFRNITNGIFGIYHYDFEDLVIESLSYDRTEKKLNINVLPIPI